MRSERRLRSKKPIENTRTDYLKLFLQRDSNTEVARAVDITMAQAKIYILMIIVKLFSFFITESSKRNGKHHCFPCEVYMK